MKKNLTLATLITCFLLSGFASWGQLVGDCAYLKGKYLELGLAPTGCFGAPRPAPAGYHPGAGNWLYDPGTGTTYTSGQIGFVADPNLDGWTTGTPAKYGDFFVPGSPQEGWSIQVGGVQSDAWLQNLSFAGTGYTGTLSGTTASYSSSGTVLTSVWQGQTTNPLQITQTTRFDTTKLWFTVNVKIKNTGAAVANNVYYLRTLDPDNDEEQAGGSFSTINNILYQLPNPANKVMVTARATSAAHAIAFLGLGTKDCRAKCFIVDGSLTPGANPAACYNQTTTYYYTLGYTGTNDVGVGLVYQLGNIPAGDSTDLTFAYVMRAVDLDSALNATTPAILAAGSLLLPGSDTINACTSASDSINLNISNGTGYTWTWAPATGLTSTTGTSSTLVLSAVTSMTTYTLIGIPLSGSVCGNDTFHFTVISGITPGPAVTNLTYCQNAVAPALTAGGSNLLWYTAAVGGTGSSVAPTPSTAVPGVYTWWVTQHLGLCTESIRVPITVTVNPAPTVHASSNSPVCQYSTLYLFATDTITTTPPPTFSWAGPAGFSSTMRNPFISNVPLVSSGLYTVTLNLNGCLATDTVRVLVKTTPVITATTQTNPTACNVSDGTITLYNLTPDSVYVVYYTFNGTTNMSVTLTADASGNITITGLHAGLYGNIFVIGTNGCPSNAMTVSMPDGAAPVPPVLSSNGPICADSTLYLYATSPLTGIVFTWIGPNGFTSTMQNPVITGATTAATGTYNCNITILATGCTSTAGSLFVQVKPTPTAPAITSNSPVCEGTTLTLSATSIPGGASFSWSGPLSFTSALTSPSIPSAPVSASGIYTAVATLNGCPSMPGFYNATVNPIPPSPAPVDVAYCQYDLASPITAAGSNLLWYNVPVAGVGSTTAPTPSTLVPGLVTYYVSQTVLGCESPRAPLVVTTKVKPIVEVTPTNGSVCQHDTMVYTSTGPSYPGASYLWQMPVGATIVSGSDSVEGPIAVVFDSTYLRMVMLTVSYNGCTTTGLHNMYVVPTPTLDLYVNPNICEGDTVTVALTSTTYHPVVSGYSWTFTGGTIITAASGGGGPYSIAWYTPGVYVVHVTGYTEQSGCPSQSMYDTVRVHPHPVATFASTGVACEGDTVVLTATVNDPSYTYTWTPAPFFTGLGSVGAHTAVANVMFPGYITLTVTDPFGCAASDSVMFTPAPCCLISFPTGFTPNGDGYNDNFRPITSGHHTLSLFRVVNRWGIVVYETTTTDTDGWDGTYGGVPQDMDTYFYVLRYTCNGTTMEESGDVVLIR
ncbi:hypothetical protein CJD36_005745 [Flavipsychrobacter stenotrophus]|uniref:Ig-like domain-containing protein n=1 Tax=Flavipsychrobacter stenotrophus TaxID=2077091 RepID=A0A2S7SX43_9BACT|nr:T9SS type B sorting domain-containing protein [Flavipsychrobacter stenotrophus]PQJ11304.1 hypothetical protein CJD36_005745 [Flavipsychrobacter stenotrophus]